MAKQVDTSRISEFCSLLFPVLNEMDLLPKRLGTRPTKYEKYPRLLLGLIRRYNSVEAGFREWESKILRDARRKEEHFPDLVRVFEWMKENKDLFEDRKDTLQYLSQSLYGRLYNYLYPRRLLINEYIQTFKGRTEAAEEAFIDSHFDGAISQNINKLEEIYSTEEIKALKNEVKGYLKARSSYFKKALSGEVPEEEIETTIEEVE